MEDIELVIKIPRKIKETIDSGQGEQEQHIPLWLCHSIANGTPLPEGHGPLTDKHALIPDSEYEDGVYYAVSTRAISEAPTLIEADNEDKEVTNEQTRSEEEIRDALFSSWLEAAKALRKWAKMLKELETLKAAEPQEREG